MIRASATPELAKENLVNAGWGLDEIQAKAILELRYSALPEWKGTRSSRNTMS
jgi:DNA gyrase subunit A